MRNANILLTVLLCGALSLAFVQARKARAEAAAATTLLMETVAGLEQRKTTTPRLEPRPVIFGIGDELVLSDAYHEELAVRVRVAADGNVLLPELGWVQAYGKERAAFEAELTQRYLEYFEEARIVVAPASALGD